MENDKIMDVKTEWNFKKEASGAYGERVSVKDFVVLNELTVTITLNEYRSLLTADADKRVKEAESGRYAREAKIAELEKEVAKLKELIQMMRGDKAEEEIEQ